jgi:hypothetical protein
MAELCKASVIVAEGHGQRIGTRFYNELGVHLKKNCEGFPMFFTFKIFKRAFLGDMKQWWSRH